MVCLESALERLVQGTVEVLSTAFEFAVNEVTFVPDVTRFGSEYSFSRLLPFLEISNVLEVSPVPDLSTFSVLLIVLPITFIEYASLLLNEDALTLGDSINPVTLIDVSIGLCQPTSTIELLILRKSLIN